MKVLCLNAGSTSLKYDLYEMDTEASLVRGNIALKSIDIAGALMQVLELVPRPDAVGHRVVHGGERLVQPVRVDAAVEAIIDECAAFAPLHNPANLAGIRAARAVFDVPQVAVFDTAFHAQMPEHAYL